MRAAIYACYSTNLQSLTSIEDQVGFASASQASMAGR